MKQHEIVLQQLLADLFDEDKSRLDLMGSDIVNSELIPSDMKLELAIMKGFEQCDIKGEPPTPENVALMSLSRDENILVKCRELAAKANARPMVHANAVWFRSWAQQEQLARAAVEIQKLADMDYADAAEKQNMMLDALISVPIEQVKQTYTRLQLIDNLQDLQTRRVKARDEGRAVGGVLHLHGLRTAIPVLAAGDLTLITAPPKAGKTTINMILAEQNTLENDVDVLVLLYETSPETIEERFISRDLLIPGGALRQGMVDLTKPPYVKAYTAYKEEQYENWKTKGHMHLEYMAGQKLSNLANQVRIHKRMADTRGRPLVVIVDYLQRITKANGKTEVEALAQISNYLKDLAVTYQCHIILFSQESFSDAGKHAGDSRAHGSNTPIFVAQVHIAMRVLNCNKSIYVSDEHGNILNNRVGGERIWQTQGKNKRQSVVRFDIMRTNDNESDNVFAAFENNLFIMLDCSHPGIVLPPFIQSDMYTFSQDMQDQDRRLI